MSTSITNVNLQVEDIIDSHAQIAEQQLKYQYVNSCMNKCVNSYNANTLSLSEKVCLNSCFYKVMENLNVFKLN